MFRVLSVSFDLYTNDFPVAAIFEKESPDKTKMIGAFIGEKAIQLYSMLTEQEEKHKEPVCKCNCIHDPFLAELPNNVKTDPFFDKFNTNKVGFEHEVLGKFVSYKED